MIEGVRLSYGLRADGRMIAVEAVESGRTDLACPDCGAPLIAKRGDIRRHHFAHAVEEGCGGGLETMLHRVAKQTIADRRGLWLPEVVASVGGWSKPIRLETAAAFEEAEQEVRIGDYRPDVLLRSGDYRLAVEITVSHPCTAEKLAAFRAMGLDAVEVDLCRYARHEVGPGIEAQVLRAAPRRWLHHAEAAAEAVRMAAWVKRQQQLRDQIREAEYDLAETRRRDAEAARRLANIRAMEAAAARLREQQAAADKAREALLWLDDWDGRSIQIIYAAVESPGDMAARRDGGWRLDIAAAARKWLGYDLADRWLKFPPPWSEFCVLDQPGGPPRETVVRFWDELRQERRRLQECAA